MRFLTELMSLNNIILDRQNFLDAHFYKEGINAWEERDRHEDFPEFMDRYVKARWWLFASQN